MVYKPTKNLQGGGVVIREHEMHPFSRIKIKKNNLNCFFI